MDNGITVQNNCIDCNNEKTARQLSDEKFRQKMAYHFRCLAAVAGRKGQKLSKIAILLKAQDLIHDLEEKLKVLMKKKGFPGASCSKIWGDRFLEVLDRDRRNYAKNYFQLLESIWNVISSDETDNYNEEHTCEENPGTLNINVQNRDTHEIDQLGLNNEFVVMHCQVISYPEIPFTLRDLELEKPSQLMKTPKKRAYRRKSYTVQNKSSKKGKLKTPNMNMENILDDVENNEKFNIKTKRKYTKKLKALKPLNSRAKKKIELAQLYDELDKRCMPLHETHIENELVHHDNIKKMIQSRNTEKPNRISKARKTKRSRNIKGDKDCNVTSTKKCKVPNDSLEPTPKRKYHTRSMTRAYLENETEEEEMEAIQLLTAMNDHIDCKSSEIQDDKRIEYLEHNMIDVQDSELAIEALTGLCSRWSDDFVTSPSLGLKHSDADPQFISPLNVRELASKDDMFAQNHTPPSQGVNAMTPNRKTRNRLTRCRKKLDYNNSDDLSANKKSLPVIGKETIMIKQEVLDYNEPDTRMSEEWINRNNFFSPKHKYDTAWGMKMDFTSNALSQGSIITVDLPLAQKLIYKDRVAQTVQDLNVMAANKHKSRNCLTRCRKKLDYNNSSDLNKEDLSVIDKENIVIKQEVLDYNDQDIKMSQEWINRNNDYSLVSPKHKYDVGWDEEIDFTSNPFSQGSMIRDDPPTISPFNVQESNRIAQNLGPTAHGINAMTPNKLKTTNSLSKCRKKLDYNTLNDSIAGKKSLPMVGEENMTIKQEALDYIEPDIKMMEEWINSNGMVSPKRESNVGLDTNIDLTSSPFSQGSINGIINDIFKNESALNEICIKEEIEDAAPTYPDLFSFDEQELHFDGSISLVKDNNLKQRSPNNQCVPDAKSILEEFYLYNPSP